MRKRVATKEPVRRLRGSVSQNLISVLVRTSLTPRSDLGKIAANQNPTRRGFGKALQWSAAWSAAAAVVACAAASELVHFDRRCVNRISTWRKIIDVWRKRCAMRLAQVLVNGVESRRGSGRDALHDLFGTRCAIWKQIMKPPKSNESMSRDMTRKWGVCCRIGYFFFSFG